VSDAQVVVRCVVAGRVQGVFFRATTRECAVGLGLRGWARNLPDETVEVVVAGAPDSVGALTQWLWQGPPAARVDSVTVETWTGVLPADGFSIR
jgi:acylphosphatase